jgi:hypothetical protein
MEIQMRFTKLFCAVAFIAVTSILAAGCAARAEMTEMGEARAFPGYEVVIPKGWKIVGESEMGKGADAFHLLTLQSGDGKTEMEIQSHYATKDAPEMAANLGNLYSGGSPTSVNVGDKGYRVALPNGNGWFAFTSLGSDVMLNVKCNRNEDKEINTLLRSIKAAKR